jgi:hypothetical protein
MFLFQGSLANYKTHYNLSWFRPLLRGNSPMSNGLILKINNGYNGVSCDRINRILIPPRYTFFSGSPTAKNLRVKHAWPRAISGWVTNQKVFLGVHK